MNQVNQLFSSRLCVANVGLKIFAAACNEQQTPCVHVEWKPAAGGNPELMAILAKLKNL